MKKATKIFTILVFVFLYIPMIVLIVASFNSGKDLAVFNNFTFDNYLEFFSDERLIGLLRNSLLISVIATFCATALGTVAAVGINRMRGKLRNLVMSVTNIPLTNPEIVTGVSLALLFAFIGTILRINNILGFWTLLIAHITFNMPYVILSVMPKLKQMDPNLEEAALDLGCTPVKAFFKVTLHEILPGIISGAIMSFTMSLDDFIISYFVSGGGFTTLPVEIYSYTKKQINPKIYALFTIMFAAILVLMVVMNLLQSRDSKRSSSLKRRKTV